MEDRPTYETIRAETVESIEQGDYDSAYRTFLGALNHRCRQLDGTSAQFADAFGVFATISERYADEALLEKIRDVAARPDDPGALYDLGYQLYEAGLFGVAATALDRANRIAPDQPGIISELCCAFEASGDSWSAVELLKEHPELTQEKFMFCYLLAFNSVVTGDLDTARQQAARMAEWAPTGEDQVAMSDRLAGFLSRADAVADVCSLDAHDLRGWQYVITGSLLTTLSPFGFPEPMGGRYAFLGDTFGNCLVGLERLRLIIETAGIQPARVFSMPDRSSQIISTAAARLLGLEMDDWPDGGSEEPCLIIANDLTEWPLESFESLIQRRAGQLLYSHAMNWTEDFPIAPEVVTLLAQSRMAPWGETMRLDPETEELVTDPPDSRPVDQVAEEILNASINEDSLEIEDGERPSELSAAFIAAAIPPLLEPENRQRFWANSPVCSSRFL